LLPSLYFLRWCLSFVSFLPSFYRYQRRRQRRRHQPQSKSKSKGKSNAATTKPKGYTWKKKPRNTTAKKDKKAPYVLALWPGTDTFYIAQVRA
jgi:hypothetical protein